MTSDPVEVKRLARGAHLRNLPEIQIEEHVVLVTRSGTIGRVHIVPRYMASWTASEHAPRALAAEGMNLGCAYTWPASEYGAPLVRRYSYGSVIVNIDREQLAAVPVPLLDKSAVTEIGDLVLRATALRHDAWEREREAITQLERLVSEDPRSEPPLEVRPVAGGRA